LAKKSSGSLKFQDSSPSEVLSMSNFPGLSVALFGIPLITSIARRNTLSGKRTSANRTLNCMKVSQYLGFTLNHDRIEGGDSIRCTPVWDVVSLHTLDSRLRLKKQTPARLSGRHSQWVALRSSAKKESSARTGHSAVRRGRCRGCRDTVRWSSRWFRPLLLMGSRRAPCWSG